MVNIFNTMGNSESSNSQKVIISETYDALPPFITDRQINNKIIIGVSNKESGIKYTDIDSNKWYYEKLIVSKKEKNYIEFLFENNTSLIIHTKDETCLHYDEKEKDKSLYFIFDSKYIKFNGKVFPEYNEIKLKNCEFDKILLI